MDKYKVKIILMDEAGVEKLSAVITSDALGDVAKHISNPLEETLLAMLQQHDIKQAIKDEKRRTLTERTGLPLEFTLTGAQLQKWYDESIQPEGYEMLDANSLNGDDCIDIHTGKFYNGKSAMIDYEISLSFNDGEEVWIGIGGYYSRGCGHSFDNDVKFKWYE